MKSAFVRADAIRLPFRNEQFDMVIGSPPYADARLYLEDGRDLGIALDAEAWVRWMLDVTAESLRVSKGAVLWVAAGKTEGRNYWPCCEGLMWEWYRRGGHAYRPCYWHRSGISGSGGDQWFRADVEYVMCFKRPGSLPWTDNTANGQPPKYAPGGRMSHRTTAGGRVGWSILAPGERGKKGERQEYIPPDLANPGNLLHTNVGGGNLGSPFAHENEAPYPVDVPAWFIASLCPPGGIVLDPFSGSGTTAHAAVELGRRAVGCDLRQSQCRLGRKRLGGITPGFAFSA